MLNRTVEPPLRQPDTIDLQDPEKIISDGQWPLFVFHQPGYEITQIDWVFAAGMCHDPHFLIAPTVVQLMDDGTTNRSSNEISTLLESYGASFYAESHSNCSSFTLITLTRHLEKLIPLINEILMEPVFPEEELQHYITRQQQVIRVEQKKVHYLARKKLYRLLFGAQSVLGFEEQPEYFSNIKRENLQEFHQNQLLCKGFCLIVSGNAEPAVVQRINSLLAPAPGWVNQPDNPSYTVLRPRNWHIEKEDAWQTAIRIGRLFHSRSHPDFIPFSVLQTIFGGYFGSRLMTNLREEKGYTYGINTVLQTMPGISAFYIATEVDKQVRQAALQEIYNEMQRLKEPVPEEELELVKNYLFGHFQRTIDGPLKLARVFKAIYTQGFDFNFFRNYLHQLKVLTPESLCETAIRYFNPAEYHQVTVG
jgi:predicted Zn-dependent peptidase